MNMANGAESLEVGWYGKLPGHGDFLTRRLPHGFVEPWDAWLREVIAGSRTRLGERWRDAFHSMPAWRFLLEPGVIGGEGWAGLLVPSVDAVGRYFPLTAAWRLPGRAVDGVATLAQSRTWYTELETMVLGALTPGVDAATLECALAAKRFDAALIAGADAPREARAARTPPPRALWIELSPGLTIAEGVRFASDVPAPRSVWLAEESEIFSACLLCASLLPGGEQFCAMMEGNWQARGWKIAGAGQELHTTA